MNYQDAVTVVTTTCAIPSCPSTKIIDVAYNSLRKKLPRAKMLILADGYNKNYREIRDVQPEEYEAYKSVLKTRIKTGEWTDVEIVEFDAPYHQAGMVCHALENKLVKTPLLMFQEHDYYFLDRPIEWDGIIQTLLDRSLSLVRFSNDYQERWHVEGWRHYGETLRFNGIYFKRASHFYSVLCIGRTDFFEWLVSGFERLFPLNGQTAKGNFLECFTTQSWYELEGRTLHPIGLYCPDGENGDYQRIWTTDGRNL